MSFIDKNVTPLATIRDGMVTIDDLLTHAAKCPDCTPIDRTALEATRSQPRNTAVARDVRANPKCTTVTVTKEVRSAVNSYAAWATGLAGRRLSNSEALQALLRISRQHADELTAILNTDA